MLWNIIYTAYAYIGDIYTHTYMYTYTDMHIYVCTWAHMEYLIKYIQVMCL